MFKNKRSILFFCLFANISMQTTDYEVSTYVRNSPTSFALPKYLLRSTLPWA